MCELLKRGGVRRAFLGRRRRRYAWTMKCDAWRRAYRRRRDEGNEVNDVDVVRGPLNAGYNRVFPLWLCSWGGLASGEGPSAVFPAIAYALELGSLRMYRHRPNRHGLAI